MEGGREREQRESKEEPSKFIFLSIMIFQPSSVQVAVMGGAKTVLVVGLWNFAPKAIGFCRHLISTPLICNHAPLIQVEGIIVFI